MDDDLLAWLLAGDVSLQYQVHRDLLGTERPDLQARIATEGWGAQFLAARQPHGHWGQGFYQPKWISSHYTLLDLYHLGLAPGHPAVMATLTQILGHEKGLDGGVNPHRMMRESDVCVNGMVLTYACYFGVEAALLPSVVDFLLAQHMPDGGFNCRSNRGGAVHSSLHSTLSVAEGILSYGRHGYTYRLDELEAAAAASRAFMRLHRLYRSDRTGATIDPRFLMLSFPSRWRYDILRALDYFRAAGERPDDSLADALGVLQAKRRRDGRWPLQARHPGQTHLEMERAGQPSRWNTLRALRVLRWAGLSPA